MKKLVMHVLNTGKYSGAENVVITLIGSMRDRTEAVYVSLDGPIRDYLSDNDIPFEPISKLTVSEMKRVIKKINPDIIHAHDFTAGLICSLATNRPIINHIHNKSPWIRRLNAKSVMYAISCFKYKRILTVSESVMDEYIFGKWFKKKTEVVGNPINLERIRSLAGNADINYDVAFLGRLSPPQKNPFLFLDIICEVKRSKPGITVIMIGDGELREDVKARINELNLETNITMVGFQKKPYKYLNQAKILLMPSSWEGYGLAAVEALALGKPVVCSNAGGLPLIVNDHCGKICRGLAEYVAVINSLLIPTNYVKYSRKSIERAYEMENVEEYMNRMLRTYSRVWIV
uniref:glycosyltransferase n=1 Tax=Eubacterium cellulosolvens TaxID=29322 RepID=UPI0004890FC3|nr:glycosyltransferase [[Eubacterium] cellulosolvens]